MSFQSILSIVILLCAQEAFTRYATLSIGLNISAHLSDENNQLTEQLVRLCMKEAQLSMADLDRFKTNEIQDADVNESTQCFAHCIYEQMGIMKNGLFIDNDDTQKLVVNSIDSANSGGDFAVCRSIRGQNKCETAYKIHQCIQKVKYGGARNQTQSMISETTNSHNDDNDDYDSADSQNGQ